MHHATTVNKIYYLKCEQKGIKKEQRKTGRQRNNGHQHNQKSSLTLKRMHKQEEHQKRLRRRPLAIVAVAFHFNSSFGNNHFLISNTAMRCVQGKSMVVARNGIFSYSLQLPVAAHHCTRHLKIEI